MDFKERVMKERDRRDGSLAIVLSALGPGVHRRLRPRLATAFHREEYRDDGREVHPAIQGLHFTYPDGRLTGDFDRSWMVFIRYLAIEPVGFEGDDYVLNGWDFLNLAREAIQNGVVPPDHSNYLHVLGVTVNESDW